MSVQKFFMYGNTQQKGHLRQFVKKNQSYSFKIQVLTILLAGGKMKKALGTRQKARAELPETLKFLDVE